MKKKLVLGLVLLVLLVSCNPFTTNIFSGIDKMKMPDLSSTSELLSVADEPQFYENLSDDDKAEVITTLENAIATTTDTTVKQEASLMLADVHLKTSGSDETLSNLNSVIGDAVNGDYQFDNSNPETLLSEIFDSSLSQSEIQTQLEAFYASAVALDTYGDTLGTNNPPIDTNSGDVATKALISGASQTIIDELVTSGAAVDTSEAITQLAAYVSAPDDPANALDLSGLTIDGPADLLSDGQLAAVEEGVGNIDDLLG